TTGLAPPGGTAARSGKGRRRRGSGAARFIGNGGGAAVMFISWRFVLLAIAGFIPMVLLASWVTVFAIVGTLALVLLVDIVLTPSPWMFSVVLGENKQVRIAEPLEVWVYRS